MELKLKQEYTVEEVLKGFEFSEFDGRGLFGLSGRLTIQPDFQRHYVYGDGKRDVAVVESILKGYPIGLIYFNKSGHNQLEVLDGQQRLTSIGRYMLNKFAVKDASGFPHIFSSLPKTVQEEILNYKILVYECSGSEPEIKEWFQTLNTVGVELTDQEILNAIYSGPFVEKGKARFSNLKEFDVKIWEKYIKGDLQRQAFWERALEWASGSKENIGAFMSKNRNIESIQEVEQAFSETINWIRSNFLVVHDEMKGVDWRRLFLTYSLQAYDPDILTSEAQDLIDDPSVEKKTGIWEYLLGGKEDIHLLQVRVFSKSQAQKAYKFQTEESLNKGVSNCPLCAVGPEANSARKYDFGEMEADHVQAWKRKGETVDSNCQMLCITHNKVKSGR